LAALNSDQSRDMTALARGGSLNMAGAVVSGVLHTLVLVTITRAYGQAEAGAFFVATSLFLLLSASSPFGADTGVLRMIARSRALSQNRDIPALLRAARWPVLALSLLLAAGIFVFAPQIAQVAVGEEAAADITPALRVLAVFLPVSSLYNVTLASTRGFGIMRATVFVERFGRSLLQYVAVATVVLAGGSTLALTGAWVAPYAVSAAVAALWLHRLVRRSPRSRGADTQRGGSTGAGSAPAPRAPTGEPATPAGEGPASSGRSFREMFGDFWRFSAPRGVSRLFTVAQQRLDIILVGALRGPVDAAVYAAATRLLIVGTMLVQAIQQVMAPRISALLAVEDRQRANDVYQASTAWLITLTWPAYLTFAVFAPLVLQVFGSGYSEGAVAVAILCTSMLVATACGSVDSVLLMGGRSSWSLGNTGAALAVMVSLDFLLIPRYGATGAAIAWAAGILVSNLLPLYQIRRFLQMNPFGPGSRAVIPLALVCFGLLPLAVRLLAGPTLPALAGSLVVSVALYLLGLRRWRSALRLGSLASVVRRRGARTQQPAAKTGAAV